MKNYEIKQAFKNLPDAGLPGDEPVTCCKYEQCDGCNYPAHGFICWHGDGKCLRTEMREVFTTSYAVVDIDGQMTEKELFSAAVSLRSVYAAFRVLRRCM